MAGRNLARVCGLALLVGGLVVGGLATPAAADSANPTRTRVTMTVDDAGLYVTPTNIPAGEWRVTLQDKRSVPQGEITVRGIQIPGFVVKAGPPVRWMIHALRQLALRLEIDGQTRGGTSVNIVVPTLKSHDKPGTVMMDITPMQIHAVRRDARVLEPTIPFALSPPPPDRPWTTVDAGATTLLIANRSGVAQHCVIYEPLVARSVDIPISHVGVIQVNLAAGSRSNSLACSGADATVRYFDLRVS